MPELSAFEVQLAIEKLKRHKSPGIDQIQVELIKAGGRTNHSEIHNIMNSVLNKEELPEEWSQSLYIFIRRAIKHCSNYRGISLLSATYKILSNTLLSKLIPYAEEIIGDYQCGFQHSRSTTDHIYCIRQYLRKNGNRTKKCISYL